MLFIEKVTKRYSNKYIALSDFSLKVENGVLGLLGPNGAGKSTLMKMIATITVPTDGKIYWKGKDIHKSGNELRNELGYLPQEFGVYPNLNAVEFLKYMAALKGMDMKFAVKRIDELLELLNLKEACKRSIGGYSGGMKQRVGIAQALLNDPKILVVDEPTVGLDPNERVNFRNLITDLSKDRIVILSTHIVSDVESTASKIVLVNKGKLVMNSKTEDIISTLNNKVWECIVSDNEFSELRKKYIISSTIRRSNGVSVRIVSDQNPLKNSVKVEPNLEDAYLYYTSDRGDS